MTEMNAPIVPPAMIGMLGGGQLGRYTLMAARTMGYRTMVLEPDPLAPAGAIADVHLVAPYDDEQALRRLGDDCDVVTTVENPPAAALELLARRTLVAHRRAPSRSPRTASRKSGSWRTTGCRSDRTTVVDHADADPDVQYPAILKTARLGYDGKGQRPVTDASQMRAAWRLLGSVPCVLEGLLLQAELSVMVARGANGSYAAYPVTENRHVNGILDISIVPAHVSKRTADRAVGLALAIRTRCRTSACWRSSSSWSTASC